MFDTKLIPLFPLNVVLLPETPLPLHIFEERYKEMINNCLKEDSQFGIVYTTSDKIQKNGCMAHIDKIIQKYDDGRLDILIKGTQRFKILDVSEEKSYMQATVEFFDDQDMEFGKDLEKLAQEGLSLIKKLQKITGRNEFIEEMEKMDFKTLSFFFGAAYGFTVEEKQHLLELTSTSARLEETIKGLRSVVNRVRMMKAIEKANVDSKKKYGFSAN
jgi:Lon protease-like protein